MLLVLRLLLMIFLRLGVAFAEAAFRISGDDIQHLLGCYRCAEAPVFERSSRIIVRAELVKSIVAPND